MKINEGLAWDDVLLVPQYSDIKSRSEVDITSYVGGLKLTLPIVSSPMDTVTETSMVDAMNQAGGLGIIHRYNTIEQQVALVKDVPGAAFLPVGAAIGATGDYFERAQALVEAGVCVICIDVAHGDHVVVREAMEKLKPFLVEKNVHLMAGNIATGHGLLNLDDWGADSVRVGIGGGSICSTRINTGHGVPNLTALLDCVETWERVRPQKKRPGIVIDGGIRNAGDMVKALAIGADAIMCGSLLAGTDESPGEILEVNGKKMKQYRGMASREAQNSWRGKSSSPEGIATTIPYKGSVNKILEDLAGNIKSGFSYSAARNICQLKEHAQFVKQTAAGQAESFTHILYRNG